MEKERIIADLKKAAKAHAVADEYDYYPESADQYDGEWDESLSGYSGLSPYDIAQQILSLIGQL